MVPGSTVIRYYRLKEGLANWLANGLSALYPKKSEEKRLLDVMLLAMPR